MKGARNSQMPAAKAITVMASAALVWLGITVESSSRFAPPGPRARSTRYGRCRRVRPRHPEPLGAGAALACPGVWRPSAAERLLHIALPLRRHRLGFRVAGRYILVGSTPEDAPVTQLFGKPE